MSDFWSAVAAVGAVGAIVPACMALWWARRAIETAREANRIAKQAAETNERLLLIEQAAEHERLTPRLNFTIGEILGGGGYKLGLTVDRPVDEMTVSLVRDFNQTADDTVMWIVEGLVPRAAGTMSAEVTVLAIPAGGARQLSLWVSDHDRAGGAVVRLRSQVRHENRAWTDLINDVTLPVRARVY